MVKEQIYEMISLPVIETLIRDLRYACRVLMKAPGFTATAILTLALAIGINTAVFSIVDGVLLQPLPYAEPERLGLVEAVVEAAGMRGTRTSQHGATWLTIRDHTTTVDRAVFSTWVSGVNVVAGDLAIHADQQRVSSGFFGVLGIAPFQGREFTGDEDRRGGPAGVIVSERFWRTVLAGDPSIVGRAISLRGEPHTVVGIMPAHAQTGVSADLWTPLRATADGEGAGENYQVLNLGFRHLDGTEAAGDARMTSATYVAGRYFDALRIPVRAGRAFDERDTASAPPVAVVNETIAREYFGAANPVGRRIQFAGAEREIVGMVGDVVVRPGFGDRGPLAAMPLAYIPLAQANDGLLRLVHGWFATAIIVRGPRSIGEATSQLRASVDPLLPLAAVRSMQEVQEIAVAQPRLMMTLLLVLAGAAVLLSAVGIHGLIASSVTERTREMGIRMALGATTPRAIATLAAPGILLAGTGVVIGAFAARGASTILQSLVWGIGPTDPATYVAVAVLFVAVATVASVLPALRILRLDPAATLRAE